MFIEPATIGLFYAWFKNGKLKNIEKLNIRNWQLFILAGALQLLLSLGKGLQIEFIQSAAISFSPIIYFLTYILLVIGILSNIGKRFMKFMLIGILLNGLVIFSNGGKMPVSIDGIGNIGNYSELPEREFDIKHQGLDRNTNLACLADIIIIPRPYPLARIISIGDLFMMLGVFVFFPEAMIYKSKVKYFSQYLTKNKR